MSPDHRVGSPPRIEGRVADALRASPGSPLFFPGSGSGAADQSRPHRVVSPMGWPKLWPKLRPRPCWAHYDRNSQVTTVPYRFLPKVPWGGAAVGVQRST